MEIGIEELVTRKPSLGFSTWKVMKCVEGHRELVNKTS